MVETIIKQNEKIKQELTQVVSRFFKKHGESPSQVNVKMIVPREGGVLRIQITIKD